MRADWGLGQAVGNLLRSLAGDITTHSFLQEVIDRQQLDTTTDALRRQITQIDGLLAEKGKGRNIQVSKYIAGKPRRALAVDNQAVTRLYGIELQNEPQDIGETKGVM